MDTAGSVEIEELATGDWARLRAVRIRSIAENPEAFGATLPESLARCEADWRERLDNSTVLVAHRARLDIGAIRIQLSERHPTIYSMWGDPSARGQGVGEKLITAAIESAHSQGRDTVRLQVKPSNARARALYERLGFTETPALPGEVDEGCCETCYVHNA